MSKSRTIPPSQALQSALTKALGTCTSCAPQIEYLEQLAQHAPEIDQQVTELRILHDHLDKLARVGLSGIPIADDTSDRP